MRSTYKNSLLQQRLSFIAYSNYSAACSLQLKAIPSHKFSNVFITKIDVTRASIPISSHLNNFLKHPPLLLNFPPPYSDKVYSLICLSKKTYSPLDPFLFNLIPTLLPQLVNPFNFSLFSKIEPVGFKSAAFYQLIKLLNQP